MSINRSLLRLSTGQRLQKIFLVDSIFCVDKFKSRTPRIREPRGLNEPPFFFVAVQAAPSRKLGFMVNLLMKYPAGMGVALKCPSRCLRGCQEKVSNSKSLLEHLCR